MIVRALPAVALVLFAIPSATACPPARRPAAAAASPSREVRIVVVRPSATACIEAPHRVHRPLAPAAESPADLPADVLPAPEAVETASPTGGPAPAAAPAVPASDSAPVTAAPEVEEGDILSLRSRRVGSDATRVLLESNGTTTPCPVHERTAGLIRFEIPAVAAAGPATVIVTDDDGRVLRRLAVKLLVEEEQLDVERVVKNR